MEAELLLNVLMSKMIADLCVLHEVEFSEQKAKALILSILMGAQPGLITAMILRNMSALIPGIGVAVPARTPELGPISRKQGFADDEDNNGGNEKRAHGFPCRTIVTIARIPPRALLFGGAT